MRDLVAKLRLVLDRKTKVGMIYGTVGAAVIAAFDMAAIALVLPLVNLAAGAGDENMVIQFLKGVLNTDDTSTITIWVAALVVLLFIIKDVLSIGFVWWMAGFKAFNRVATSSDLLRHYLHAPYTETASRSSADLIRTMGDGVIQVYGSVAFGLMSIVSGLISVGSIIVALLLSAPVPTVALLVYLGAASVGYLRFMRPRMQAAGEQSAEAASDAWRSALAALGGRKESKLRSSEEFFVRRYREASIRGAQAARYAEVIAALPRYLLEILFIIAIGVILVTATLSTQGTAGGGVAGGIGMLALFVAAGFRMLPNITVLVGAVASLRYGLPYLDLVHQDMTAMRALPTLQHATFAMDFLDELRVSHLGFTYPVSDHPVLRDVNLCIKLGSSVALVGGSGAGKTTLVDLLLGLHAPTQGSILVDGRDIWEDIQAWQCNLGYVPQDVFLLESSLAENIAFDQERGQIDNERLWASIERAQLRDLVDELPDGVETHLGERGSRLSGGQRQRVGIARALYRDPSVLVLDEATSALDNETEHRISQAVYSLTGTMTIIIVAHRLSTVKNVDQIVVMNQGQVEATGTFQEVRRKSELFDRMVELGSLEAS